MDCDESLPDDKIIQDVPLILEPELLDSKNLSQSISGFSNTMENTDESMEEDVPKILKPELRDVFHLFANMLDAKSFMRLAMTSKDLYKQCMEDKSIKINVDEKYLYVYGDEGGAGFYMRFSIVSERHYGSYMATLRKQKFNLTVSEVCIDAVAAPEYSIVDAARDYLKKFGVNRIKSLRITEDFTEWEEVITFIKEFRVNMLHIFQCPVPLPILHSLLQLDLNDICYDGEVPIDFVLEIDSPIQRIEFTESQYIEWDKFIQLSWKIQTGSLKYLVADYMVNWEDARALPFDHKGELPEERPLVFKRMGEGEVYHIERYCLHWQGGVTKCIKFFDCGIDEIHLFKCPDNELPPILREDEDVLKDLAQLKTAVSCFESQFLTFVAGFTLLDSAYEGPLPTERPLYFKIPKGLLKLAKGDEPLEQYTWKDGQATWKHFEWGYTHTYVGRSLKKTFFTSCIKNPTRAIYYFICKGLEEFDFWLEDYKKVDFDHSAPLPKERPLVFERSPSEDGKHKIYVVLLEDALFQCVLSCQTVEVKPCESLNRPPILSNANNIKEILQESYLEKSRGLSICVDHETFLSGFELFKTTLYHKQLPVVFEKTQNVNGMVVEERWFNLLALSKCVWKNGHASISNVDPHEIPLEFMKELFKQASQTEISGIFMNLEQFHSCLEQFETLPFDYSAPLPKNSPFAFVKEEIRHSCSNESDCECSEVFYCVWLLFDGVNVCYCSWGENVSQEVVFKPSKNFMPPILKSGTYLKNMLEKACDLEHKEWYGSVDEFTSCFKEYTMISSSHKGPLPEERPLLVEQDSDRKLTRYLLLKDGTVIMSEWAGWSSYATFEVISPFTGTIPSVFMHAL